MLPGMYHCQGGTGPSRVDWLHPIVTWVEQDKPPNSLHLKRPPMQQAVGLNPTEGNGQQCKKLSEQDPSFLTQCKQIQRQGKR